MNSDKVFDLVATALKKSGVEQVVINHVLHALMDKIGVPMMSAVKYRTDPLISPVFETREGITYTDQQEN